MVSEQRKTQDAKGKWQHAERAAIVIVLLIAAALRFYALADLPLGLDQDEIINAMAVRGILAGERPIFITAGWGREPVYAYSAAGTVSLAGDMTLGMRLTSVVFSMLFLSVAYVTARKLLGRAVGLMTLGWLAGGFWPLMTSRAGERNIMLALFAALTIYLFYRALCSNTQYPIPGTLGIGYWVLAGLALGATLWTYQSGRITPIIFTALAAYLAIWERDVFRAHWRGIVVFLAVGLLLASPLFVYLATHPSAETGDFKTQSLQALQRGDWKPMLAAALGTLGLFTMRGEIYWLHNIPGRPILDWLSGILFYAGFVVILWRLVRQRRRKYVLLLSWLIIGLVPAMITDPPSHHRMANVMAAAYMLPALGTDWIRQTFLARRSTVFAVAIAALLTGTAVITAHDFFGAWAAAPEVQDLHFSKLAQLSRDLDRDPDTSSVVVAGTHIEDIEPLVPIALMKRHDISFRWHDQVSTQVIPAGVSQARYFDPASGLSAKNTDLLRRELLARAAAAPDVWLAPPGDALPASVGVPVARPVSFDRRIEFLGAELSASEVTTFWRVLRDGSPSSTAMFVHLTTPDMHIVAQDDRLGFPTHSWHAGDVFSQAFTLSVPDALTGRTWLEIGIYDRPTGQRWQVSGAPGVTRVLMQWPAIR